MCRLGITFKALRRTALDIPRGRKIRVAITLATGAQVIDVAGPWEVFQDVTIEGEAAFELYTVSATAAVVIMSGGMQILPNFTVDNAPQPDIILSPAHKNCPVINDWIKDTSQRCQLTCGVCTGVYNLGEAGLIDGLTVTTYHQSLESLREKYPLAAVNREMRFVDQGHIITAGGISACIDMSLHIVKRCFGTQVAQETADLLEYEGHGWRQTCGLKPTRARRLYAEETTGCGASVCPRSTS